MTATNLFCEKCSLQFDKKIVYDIHLSFVHNVKENKDEKLTEINEKDGGLGQSYIYQVLQTIQMKLILLCVWAEPVVLGSAKTALRFIYKI